MKTIVIANHKGGIGKTTTATNIASILHMKGKKVLLIDCDPQGNSTDTYKAEIDDVATLYDVILDNDRIPLTDAIQTCKTGYIVASDPLLKNADDKLNGDIDGFFRLQDAISNLDGWDYVIIDTPPQLGCLLYNALIAANEVIIPITPDRYGLQGLSQLSKTIVSIRNRYNRDLTIKGLLLVKYKPHTKLSNLVRIKLIEISKIMNTKVFDTYIRETIKTQESQAERMTVVEYAPNSTTALDYFNLVNEIFEEVEGV